MFHVMISDIAYVNNLCIYEMNCLMLENMKNPKTFTK